MHFSHMYISSTKEIEFDFKEFYLIYSRATLFINFIIAHNFSIIIILNCNERKKMKYEKYLEQCDLVPPM